MTLSTLKNWLDTTQGPSEVATSEAAEYAVSGALFIGEDPSDPDANGSEIFEYPENHPVAVSSIIQHASNRAKFDPSSQSLKEAATGLEEFITTITTFPAFTVASDYKDLIRHNGDIQAFLEEVNRYYLRSHEKERKEATNKIMSGLLSHEHSGAHSYTISHLTIENLGTEDDLFLRVLSINQNVDHDDNGMIMLTQDNAELTITKFKVDRKFLESNADNLATFISRADIEDVVKKLTTPHCILLS
ncbi:uncharacterized protein BYT42DRAFT_578935 [Radiomyces spectabilis]|uniref:uncharacterized protein n=1 Tax=Radiomyces spectabilis TaxID=64574 RepID=UPI00221FADC4|nr:uncharacterized protein BYT42DRAFT_578935 [Radiomyces spectabilis]KAI8373018.1 hypothetical protein BYT42DRAFT_578935 [Radiomyces spectabilis]